MDPAQNLFNLIREFDLQHNTQLLKKWRELDCFHEGLSATSLIATVNAQGRIIKTNPIFEETTGYSAEELQQMTMHDLAGGYMNENEMQELGQTIFSGKIWQGEVCKKHKRGHRLWFKAIIIPLLDEQEPEGFLAFYLDTSRTKQSEQERLFFFEMLNLSSDAIQVGDKDGNIIYVNEKSVSNLRMPREEIIGKKVWEIEKVFSNIEEWHMHMADVKANPDGLILDGYNVRQDGSIFPVEANVRYLEMDDEPYIVANIRDATKRKQQVMQMQKTQQLLNEAQRIAEVASMEISSANAPIQFSENAWRVFGLKSYADFRVKNINNLIHPEDLDRVTEEWQSFMDNGGLFQTEFRVFDHYGDVNYIQSIVRSYKDTPSNSQHFIGTVQNITRTMTIRKELENRTRELEQRNRELDQFAQIVSHDLKSPLRAIHNLSDWLQESLNTDEEESRQHLELMKRRVERMERLINGILHYSSAGRKGIPEEFDTGKIIQEVLESLTLSYPQMKARTKGKFPLLAANKLIFEQVVTNLANNAVKHNDKDKRILTISFDEDADNYIFSFIDNGPGIDPRFHQRIFEMFQTLSSKDSIENTGVGLAIVKKLCDEMNWSIELESTPYAGSTFTLLIPRGTT